MPHNLPWVRDELILALDLYFRCNPRHTREKNPLIVELSGIINVLPIHTERAEPDKFRNPNGVYMKMINFLRLDPDYPGVGLDAGSKRDVEVWNEFANDHKLLHQVAEAIRANVTQPETISTAVEDEDDFEAPEGNLLHRLHKSRERSASLIRKRKQQVLGKYGKLACEACGFDFQAVYGDIGVGFIECHHTVPVSQLRPGQTTKLSDLALLCANCHRMVHRGKAVMSIDDLKNQLEGVKTAL